MNTDGRDLELAPERAAVQGLDVLELVNKVKTPCLKLRLRQGIKHEGIVRVRTMPDPNRAVGGEGHRLSLPSRGRSRPHPAVANLASQINGRVRARRRQSPPRAAG